MREQKIVQICEERECLGCGACAQSCPIQAISMKPDKEGFLHPNISEKCIGCKKCLSACPVRKEMPTVKEVHGVYAVQLLDKKLLLQSTSGGAFILLAGYVLDHGGAVFGAAYDENMVVRHICAEKLVDVFPMQGSKYVQSDTQNTYCEAAQILKAGRYVLYSGTPCQIEGLLTYLGDSVSKDKLITLDIICSGVPSSMLFREYLDVMKKGKDTHITNYEFRNKEKYGCSNTTVITKKKNDLVTKITIPDRTTNSYYVAFGKQAFLRQSCYDCQYRTVNSNADFTCGDYVGTNEEIKQIGERAGISQLIIHSKKAGELFEELKPRIKWLEITMEDAKEGNRMLYSSVPMAIRQPEMFDSLSRYGYKKTAEKFFPVRKFSRVRNLIPIPIRKMILDILRNRK